MSADFEGLAERLRAQGFTVQASGKRWKAVPPDPTKPIVHFSASAERFAYRNAIADLRRSGFVDRPVRTPKPPPIPDEPAFGDDPTKPETFAPQEIPMPAPDPKSLDALFTALKDARVLAGMAGDDLARANVVRARAEEELREAENKARAAGEFLARSNADLEKARAAFEKAFAAEGST